MGKALRIHPADVDIRELAGNDDQPEYCAGGFARKFSGGGGGGKSGESASLANIPHALSRAIRHIGAKGTQIGGFSNMEEVCAPLKPEIAPPGGQTYVKLLRARV